MQNKSRNADNKEVFKLHEVLSHEEGYLIRVTEISHWLIGIFLASTLLLCTPITHSQTQTSDQLIQQKLKSLSLDDKIGQLLMVGFYGSTLDEGLGQTLDRLHPGFLVTFSRNIKSGMQIANLNYQAQLKALSYNRLPLLIGIDQEGGAVTRIKTRKPLPSAWSIGATGDPSLAISAGQGTGKLLRELGFNMDLAPVLDVAAPRRESFLGTRAFSPNAQTVSLMGNAFAKGLKQERVLPTAKHFPGHGKVKVDSHVDLPVKNVTLSELFADDLIPFKAWAKEYNDSALMMAHLSLPKVDPTGLPATFSKVMIKDILRTQLGYSGLVLSDDLDMGGAEHGGTIEERALRALEAGVDVLMLAWNRKSQTRVFQGLKNAVRTGKLSEARINESVVRILKAKQAFAWHSVQKPTFNRVDQALNNPQLAKLADRVARANFRTQAQVLKSDSFSFDASTSIVIVSYRTQFAKSFAQSNRFRKVYFGNPQTINIEKISRFVLGGPNRLIVATIDGTDSAQFLNNLPVALKNRTVILNNEQPGRIETPELYAGILNLGTYHPRSGEWVAQVLAKPGYTEERIPAEEDDL